MLSNYTCLDSKTFNVEKDIIAIDKQLSKTISILNKKGYYTEICSSASISRTFQISAIIHDLIEEKLLIINDNTKDKIKNIIKKYDYDSTLIIFKEEYKFDDLPKGYKLIGKNLYYYLSALEEEKDIKFKTLIELDKEHNNSLKLLEEWANKLSNRK